MDFLSKCYKNTKLTIGGLGGILSVTTIVMGAVSGGAFLIVGGSLWLSSSAFVLFDGVRAHSIIKKDVDRLRKLTEDFEQENMELKNNVDTLNTLKTRFIQENNRLTTSINDSRVQINNMVDLNNKYQTTLSTYKESLKEEKANTDKLKKNIKDLNHAEKQLKSSVQQLKQNLNFNKLQIEELEVIKQDYIRENQQLQEVSNENKKSNEVLKSQVKKLKVLYDNTRQLLSNLTESSDIFQNLSGDLEESVDELQGTKKGYSDILVNMKRIVEELKTSSFKDLDMNNDGVVDANEFNQYAESN